MPDDGGDDEAAEFENKVRQEAAYLRLVHPTPDDIPSCFNLLDVYFSCNGMRGHVKSIYRHGERLGCSSKLDDVKFCMSNKFMDSEQKYEAWIDRRARWWASRRVGKSSEDVWAMREKPLINFPKPITEMKDFGLGPVM